MYDLHTLVQGPTYALGMLRHASKQVRRDISGASAVEFALMSGPFISIIGAFFQFCLIVWANQNLDEALQRSARTLYTGGFQSSNKSLKDTQALLTLMRNSICGSSQVGATVFGCSGLKLDIAVVSNFSAGNVPKIIDDQTGTWSKDFGGGYACAKPGDIVVLTAAVKYALAFRYLNFGFDSFGDGSSLIVSTVVMRTEPYDTSSGSAC
ncbi:TadE/TadG family type IV pilus assembly protein [Methylobacterium sp. J-068]|uniref:TadE/TadG family type IV pilus assembly protein n=1 Tax=Methylobacterium sp. J-068 TaxID=2836649 RepID=UPI001FB9DC8F|nr:TadE/TadG family type IV pilus assembly protein [Methylobacterium sp. J-068]MCJ2033187.1 pilus assembly protein [Methylobacterium sp. J-068]